MLREWELLPLATAMTAASLHGYRADIDGLRAIAVLAVIGFHASATTVPGGFVGVDIFFVISGFLISGLIFNGLESGNFSFAHFYARRIKRIFPAYIVVALATLVFSSYLLIPNDYIFYTTSLAASWAFAANIFFSMLSWGYFVQRTEEFPLLHTWSLSVEEQFYFIFPILLIFAFRYFKKHLIYVLLVLGVVFVSISELTAGQVKSYFLLSSRAHELIIGVLTFLTLHKFPLKSNTASNILAMLGMVLIVGSLLTINRDIRFPGMNSLYPCLGTALLIYACQKENALTPLLKSRILVFIGLISYSLYLWHWPIFSFLKYRRIEIDFWIGVSAIALAFMLSVITWRLVEIPIRKNTKIHFKKAFVQIYLVPAMMFFSVGAYSYFTEGVPQRFPDDIRQLISSYSFERDLTRSCSIRAEDYRKITSEYLSKNCAFGDLDRDKAEVLLIGDSHAQHFKPFIDRLSRDARLKSVFHVQGGCFPTNVQLAGMRPDAALSTCEKRNADLLRLAGNYKFVVLAGFWSSEPDPNFEKKLEFVVDTIIKAGATPVIFKDNPYYEPDLSRCILYRRRGWVAADENCNIPYRFVVRTQAADDAVIDRVTAKYPLALTVDPKRVMCSSSECATYSANTAFYKDANHINTEAAQLLGERYLAHTGNPFDGLRGSRTSEDVASGDPKRDAQLPIESSHIGALPSAIHAFR